MDEKKKLAASKLKIKAEIFNPNYLLMHANFLNSELNQLSLSQQEFDYTQSFMKCNGKRGTNLLVCMMSLDCKNELVYYSRCLIRYQKSKFLCKIQKRELLDCYQRQVKSINLMINNEID